MSQEIFALWADVLQVLEGELSRPSFDAWLRTSVPVAWSDDTIVVQVPHDFARDWLETRYSHLIASTMRDLAGKPYTVRFVAKEAGAASATAQAQGQTQAQAPAASPDQAAEHRDGSQRGPEARSGGSDAPKQTATASNARPAPSVAVTDDAPPTTVLNPKYTFETFVVGLSNRFAHAAAMAVSEAPGKTYNPLFVYGGVGLGKTHLMQAVGHQVLQLYPGARVVYVPCEQFTNELINAIRFETTDAFRERYRNVDVLLIDDIQFLAGKERTQEEFFHTFNTLYEAGKQIVISSDRPPKDIATLESRLRSRFEWGLITDIQAPDFETKMAILNKKAAAEGLDVPQDVFQYIAQHVHSNIRELEGALIRVTAFAALNKKPLSVEVAAEAMRDILPSARSRQLTAEMIQQVVADYYHIDVAEMKSKTRVRMVSLPRQIAMYLCRELTDMSLPKIGEEFGGRDHTTVIHACEKIQQDLRNDAALEADIKDIIARLHKR